MLKPCLLVAAASCSPRQGRFPSGLAEPGMLQAVFQRETLCGVHFQQFPAGNGCELVMLNGARAMLNVMILRKFIYGCDWEIMVITIDNHSTSCNMDIVVGILVNI